jgi:hypothetical protein
MFKVFRKLFWVMAGFAVGLGSSWVVTRRVRRVARRYVPAEIRDRWGDNMRAAVSEGRTAMRSREAELKAGIGRNSGK